MSDTYTEFAPSTGMDRDSIAANGYGMVQYGRPDNNVVGFYRKSVQNAAKSRAEGKPVYESLDYVKIHQPGDKLNIIDRPATELEKQLYPRQWQQYQQGRQQIPDGIPIDLVFPSQPEIADMLRGFNVHTAEQLANLSAHGISTVGMGCTEWVTKAQNYLKQAEKGVDFHRFTKEIKERDQKIETLTRQLTELSTRVAQITAQPQPQPQPMMNDPRMQMAPQAQSFDVQASMIANTVHPQLVQPPAQFSHTVASQKPRGRPKGSKNKPKET